MSRCAFDENRICNNTCVAFQKTEEAWNYKAIKCLRGNFDFKIEKPFIKYDTDFDNKKSYMYGQ